MSVHNVNDLAGLAEIAQEFGVNNSAVWNWAQRYADFPQPLKKLTMGPVYDMVEVRVWHAKRFT